MIFVSLLSVYIEKLLLLCIVGVGRLELPWVTPYAPEAYACANFATRPCAYYILSLSVLEPDTFFALSIQ